MSENYVKILDDKDPALRKKAESVTLPLSDDDRQILTDILKYVVDSHDESLQEKYQLLPASGLAAPQIGINKRMIAVFTEEVINDKKIIAKYALVNPKIISHSQQMTYIENGEGCLSVKEPHEGYVPRYARISVEAFDLLQDKVVKIRAKGYLAIVLQHEIDHLSGILFYDHINKDDPFYAIPDAIII
ncbi:MAG: peptide deformylase [Erysipelotrichaceae bacterium]|nr:peptide deformylase [Erysipelotrichaceae bacterium]MDD3923642.1 peptide deformylase [Erysipelotrichaceae bacterium]MDD4641997.1 peptide deformylase [Erysipelotrichaceae bacterium]